GERSHDETHQLVPVIDQPWPGYVWHRVSLGQRPGDGRHEMILICSQLQLAGGSDVVFVDRIQSQARAHALTLRRSRNRGLLLTVPYGCQRGRTAARRGSDNGAHDPAPLRDLPNPREAISCIQLLRACMQVGATLRRPLLRLLRIRFYNTAAGPFDL